MNDPWYSRVIDPTTEAAELAHIAAYRPDLRPHVVAHPNAYPELLAWLRDQGDPAVVVAAVDARTAWAQAQAAPPVPAAAVSLTAPTTVAQAPAQVPAQAWAQVPAQTPALGQPGAGAGAGVVPAGTGPADPARRRKRLIVVGAVAAVAVALGGAAFAVSHLVGGKFRPAASPEAAAERLVEAAARKDLLGMAGILSPAETESLRSLVASSARGGGIVGTSAKDVVSALDMLRIDVRGVETRTTVLQDGLARVGLVDGTVTVDADVDRLVDLLMSQVENVDLGGLGDLGYDVTPSDLTEMRRDMLESLEDELPLSVDLGEIARENPDPLFVVTVEEGGGWYVSPYLTVGEILYLESGTTVPRGTMMGEGRGTGGDSPTDAADAVVRSVAHGDARGLYEMLALPDRRMLSVYGPGSFDLDDDVDVSGSFRVLDESRGTALLVPDALEVVVDRGYDVAHWRFDEACVTHFTRSGGGIDVCLDELPLASDLGLGDLALVAVEEGDGWFVSVTESVARAGRLASEAIADLEDRGVSVDARWYVEKLERMSDYDVSYDGMSDGFDIRTELERARMTLLVFFTENPVLDGSDPMVYLTESGYVAPSGVVAELVESDPAAGVFCIVATDVVGDQGTYAVDSDGTIYDGPSCG